MSLARPGLHHFVAALLVFATPATAPACAEPEEPSPSGRQTTGFFSGDLLPTGQTTITLTGTLRASFFNLTQQIFTPTIDAPMPIPGQRPYAGILTGEFGVQLVKPRLLQSFGISVGTTGRKHDTRLRDSAELASVGYDRGDYRNTLGSRFHFPDFIEIALLPRPYESGPMDCG